MSPLGHRLVSVVLRAGEPQRAVHGAGVLWGGGLVQRPELLGHPVEDIAVLRIGSSAREPGQGMPPPPQMGRDPWEALRGGWTPSNLKN